MIKNWTCVFTLFCTREILSWKKKKMFKIDPITSFILLLLWNNSREAAIPIYSVKIQFGTLLIVMNFFTFILMVLNSQIILFTKCSLKTSPVSNKLNVKIELSPSKKMFYLLPWKPFKNDEKCFLFHIKSPFRSKDI